MNTLDPFDMRLGQKLAARRKCLKISQAVLAAALGVTPQQLQKYEKGANRLSCSRLRRLAATLDVHPCWFFEDEEGLPPLPEASPRVQKTMAKIRFATERQQSVIAVVVDALLAARL
jgi:transcriptional regulator with XRE-family HTH domain